MVYSPEELLMVTYLASILIICLCSLLVILICEVVKSRRNVKRFEAAERERKAREIFKRKWDRQTIPMLNRFSEGK